MISKTKVNSSKFELVAEYEDFINESQLSHYKEFSNKSFSAYVYKNVDFLPRAFFVGGVKVIKDESLVLAELRDEGFDPREYVVLEEDFDAELTNTGGFQEAELSYHSPNKMIVDVDTDNPGFLVLSEVWYPGWEALDNGEQVKIYKTNYALRGVYLEAGEHRVEFAYRPLSYKIGKWVSGISIVLIAGFIAGHVLNRSRRS